MQGAKMKETKEKSQLKSKKFVELEKSNKRQAGLIGKYTMEVNTLRQQLTENKKKLQERERAHQQNKDLVTKNCAQ